MGILCCCIPRTRWRCASCSAASGVGSHRIACASAPLSHLPKVRLLHCDRQLGINSYFEGRQGATSPDSAAILIFNADSVRNCKHRFSFILVQKCSLHIRRYGANVLLYPIPGTCQYDVPRTYWRKYSNSIPGIGLLLYSSTNIPYVGAWCWAVRSTSQD